MKSNNSATRVAYHSCLSLKEKDWYAEKGWTLYKSITLTNGVVCFLMQPPKREYRR